MRSASFQYWTVSIFIALQICATYDCSYFSPTSTTDAASIQLNDAGVRSPARRRRRSNRTRNALAQAHGNGSESTTGDHAPEPAASGENGDHAGDPGSATANDLALGDQTDEVVAPRVRPRITENGPMVSDNVGSRESVQYDMTNHETPSGPMGLEPSAISHGLDPLLGRLSRCADATTDDQGNGPHGRINIRLRIHPNGSLAAAQVSGGGGSGEFVTCVRRVVASARFQSFNGPDVFANWGFDVQ